MENGSLQENGWFLFYCKASKLFDLPTQNWKLRVLSLITYPVLVNIFDRAKENIKFAHMIAF